MLTTTRWIRSAFLCLCLFTAFSSLATAQPNVTVSVPDNQASEWSLGSPNTGRFTLTRNNVNLAMPLTVTVSWYGSATPNLDYNAIGTSHTFPAGQSTLHLDVVPINDITQEDVETVTITLQNGSNYTHTGVSTGMVVIYNDDYTPCTTSTLQLCLQNGRFKVQLTGRGSYSGTTGKAIPLNNSTGGFWLFSNGNVEVGVKVLLAPDQKSFWVYHGAATDVPYQFTVTDLANPSRHPQYLSGAPYCGGGDTGAFQRAVALPPGEMLEELAAADGGGFETGSSWEQIHQSACTPNSTTSCLLGGRFQVRVLYKTTTFSPWIAATAVPLTGETAFFWFYSADNLEIFVKVLNGASINSRYWVYYGSMTDVEYKIEVVDTVTLASKDYLSSASGPLCGAGDTNAFVAP